MQTKICICRTKFMNRYLVKGKNNSILIREGWNHSQLTTGGCDKVSYRVQGTINGHPVNVGLIDYTDARELFHALNQ